MSADLLILNGGIGTSMALHCIVLKGTCPFCEDKVTFRQLAHDLKESFVIGENIPVQCEGCNSVCVYSIKHNKLYPSQKIRGVSDLPAEIDKYYQQALRCISADSPDGAVTLFRKTIHAVGIHYRLAKKNDDKKLYDLIEELFKHGHIIKKLRDALLAVKDIGNDGAHINENEPDMEQALALKHLIDTTLSSTILTDNNIAYAVQKHNPAKAP